eukprot:6169893-Pyramimonas_sp.AAC.1
MAWRIRILAPECMSERLGLRIGASSESHRLAFERVIIAFHACNIQARLTPEEWASPSAAIASAKAGRAMLLHTYTVPV